MDLDLDQVEDKLKQDSSIRGICFAHVAGNPPDMDRISFLAEEYGVHIIYRYVYREIGYNLKPIEIQGAFGLEQLKKLPQSVSCL